jgi:GTP-binding protein
VSFHLDNSNNIRNIAIIAHVDHGKTTLVDGLLKQSNTFRDNQLEMSQELIMDSGDQEKERGITITAKITSIVHSNYRINIIDTPGHADFGSEVERTLNMADGCLLIVDAQEGPMPQTKFVLKKALAHGLKPIVVINKIDKTGSRIAEVEDELADLFLELALHEDQLHYPIYYAIGSQAKAWTDLPDDIHTSADLSVLLDGITTHVPPPQADPEAPLQMLTTALSWDSFQGKYAIGKISKGTLQKGQLVIVCKKDGSQVKTKVDKLYRHHGLQKEEISRARAGDIISVTGINDIQIGETIADVVAPEALPVLEVEPPTLRIYLGPNTSPFKGREAEYSTSRQLGDRLKKELETNIGLEVSASGIGYLVAGRGELHLGVLMEAMRREGYEFEVGQPQVVTKQEDGITLEPLEEVTVEVSPDHMGSVQSEFGKRRAELKEQLTSSKGTVKMLYHIPTRNLLGLKNILITQTKGTIIMNSIVIGYTQQSGQLQQQRNGVLISWETGTTTAYAIQTAEERGVCFVGPGTEVYAGQIIGLNTRGDDMDINVVKEKHLTNMRSSGSDGVVQLTPPTILGLEQCLDFLEKDELLEVTPKHLRLRKRELDPNKRKRLKKQTN